MKYAILFLLFPVFCFGQIDGTDVTPTDTVYLVVESGEVESVTYYRMNFVEVSQGGKVFQRTTPVIDSEFLVQLYAEKEKWIQAVANIDAELARLAIVKAWYEGIEDEIDAQILLLE